MKTEQELIKQLEAEGYTDVRVCPMPPTEVTPPHTHVVHTVHIILDGELTVTENGETKTCKAGDRVEFPAGTTHTARSSIDDGRMVIGVKAS
ncbi:cupin domain-containing protein [Candidatus Berkelbacteria bacterium]|nr:cupin domain-containing protein [Candidatus Berkelbacteria bacterium]